jgi:hypothetical protein
LYFHLNSLFSNGSTTLIRPYSPIESCQFSFWWWRRCAHIVLLRSSESGVLTHLLNHRNRTRCTVRTRITQPDSSPPSPSARISGISLANCYSLHFSDLVHIGRSFRDLPSPLTYSPLEKQYRYWALSILRIANKLMN